MCGRFTQSYSWAELHGLMSLIGTPQNLRPRYNIAPTTVIDIVRSTEEGTRGLAKARWGLVPRWWNKPLKELRLSTFNARAETVHESKMYAKPFQSRRCIIPASGYFEWTGDRQDRQPHYFTAADGSPILGFAGLWDTYRGPETGEEQASATMIVCEANTWMSQYHDRMPAILGPENFDAWLSCELPREALRPAAEDALQAWAVAKKLIDDDPATIEPLPETLLV
jgi:putative SOS response-associated peptidase YedK